MELRDQLQSALGTAYTIERELHGGGMSRVFVAQDESLGRMVVVKVLAPELAGSVNLERFKREISLAARLQHPHIVPLLTAGEVDGVPYFTMPFVEGESLRTRIAHGELPVADTVALLRDMAKALDYAHSKGVVHRDIKPDNVLLSGGSAAITDFGVAKAISSATHGGEQLTSIGIALGTPAYMAPEQASADPATDHRADIYAFGATAYEMLTGRSPFAGRSAQQMLAAHATEVPTDLNRLRPAVPKPIAELVTRCLEKRAADRPQSARDLLQALDAVSTPASLAASSSGERRSRRVRLLATGAALAIVAAGAIAVVKFRSPAQPTLNPRRVMVASFENLTRDTAFALIGRMASDFITQGVSQLDSVEAVSPAVTLASPAVADGHVSDRQAAEQVHAGTVVSGSIYKQGDSLRFNAQVVDVTTGKVLQSVENVTAPLNDPLGGIRALRERLMGAFASQDTRSMQFSGGAPRYDAYEAFLRATEVFNRQQYAAAIPMLERAVALDSTFTTAAILLATAHSNLQHWATTDSIARIVDRRRDRMSRMDRSRVDWLLANVRGDLETTHRLTKAEAARDSAWVPLWLTAFHALYLNRPRETVKILNALEPAQTWAPKWMALAAAHHALGEFDEELRTGQHADSLFPGRFVSAELRALAAKGDVRRIQIIVDSVERASTDTAFTTADQMLAVAIELRAHGQDSAAAALLARALKWTSAQPPHFRLQRNVRRTTAGIFFAARQFDSAQTRYTELAAEDTSTIMLLGRVGSSAALRGDTATANRISEQLARTTRPYTFGEPSYWRAAIAASLGQREAAVRLITQALGEGARKMPEIHRLEEFQTLRDYEPFKELLRPKG